MSDARFKNAVDNYVTMSFRNDAAEDSIARALAVLSVSPNESRPAVAAALLTGAIINARTILTAALKAGPGHESTEDMVRRLHIVSKDFPATPDAIRSRVDAMCRLLTDSGDMSPVAVRQILKVVDGA